MDLTPALPAFRISPPVGMVVAEVGDYDHGDGVRATMTAEHLMIEMHIEGNEGLLQIPVVSLLDAIQLQTKQHES